MGMTIDQMLNSLGLDSGSEKTASSKESAIEKQARSLGLISDQNKKTETQQTKIASENGGTMNLLDLYNSHFGAEKTASAEETVMSKEAQEKLAGEVAGKVFRDDLDNRVVDFAIKIAMDTVPDSEATQDIQEGAGVIPGADVENPQLETNRPEDADVSMDLTPEHFDLSSMDGAVEKARLENALAEGNLGDLSHKTVQVASGMETPDSQKTASLSLRDLSRDQLRLLNVPFSAGMMKKAHAIVSQENVKIAELSEVAQDAFAYGQELAMKKIAEMEEAAEKAKEDESKESEEEESKEEPSDAEKTASAQGKFILEGFWNTLMEKGAEFYGDENIYLEELVKEAGLADLVSKLKGKASALAAKAKPALSAAGSKAKATARLTAQKTRQAGKNYVGGVKSDFSTMMGKGKSVGKNVTQVPTNKERAMAGAKLVGKTVAPAAALGLGGAALYNKNKKDR